MPDREKVTFEQNVTQLVTLSFDDGKLVSGLRGPQWQYFLEDDKIMWVDPDIHDKITASGAVAGDTVAITKVKKGKNSPWWTVEKTEDAPGEEDQREWNARTTSAAPRNPKSEISSVNPPELASAAKETSLNFVHTENVKRITAASVELIAAFVAALDATKEAEAYAARIGVPVKFEADTIWRMAATVYIGGRQGATR